MYITLPERIRPPTSYSGEYPGCQITCRVDSVATIEMIRHTYDEDTEANTDGNQAFVWQHVPLVRDCHHTYQQ